VLVWDLIVQLEEICRLGWITAVSFHSAAYLLVVAGGGPARQGQDAAQTVILK
jgi:hypothetical protein